MSQNSKQQLDQGEEVEATPPRPVLPKGIHRDSLAVGKGRHIGQETLRPLRHEEVHVQESVHPAEPTEGVCVNCPFCGQGNEPR